MEGIIELKCIKLGPSIFVSLEDAFSFTADTSHTDSIDNAVGSINLGLRYRIF
jgi:hypothetical protein